MKPIDVVLAIFLATAFSGCGEREAPKQEAKVESPSEALKNDQRDIERRFSEQKAAADAGLQLESARNERQQYVDAMSAVAQKLSTAIRDAGSTGRSDFPALIKKVDAIKIELATVVADDCTDNVRTSLQDAIAITLDAFNSFAKEKGPASKASGEKMGKAVEKMDLIGQELNSCRSL